MYSRWAPKGLQIQVGTCYSFDCQLTFLHKRKEREQGYKHINCSDILSNEELPLSKSAPVPGMLLKAMRILSLASGRALAVRFTCIIACQMVKDNCSLVVTGMKQLHFLLHVYSYELNFKKSDGT